MGKRKIKGSKDSQSSGLSVSSHVFNLNGLENRLVRNRILKVRNDTSEDLRSR